MNDLREQMIEIIRSKLSKKGMIHWHLISHQKLITDIVDELISLLPVEGTSKNIKEHRYGLCKIKSEGYAQFDNSDPDPNFTILKQLTLSEAVKEENDCENCKYLLNDYYPCLKCDDDYCMWEPVKTTNLTKGER